MNRILAIVFLVVATAGLSFAQESEVANGGDRVKIYPNPVNDDFVHIRVESINNQAFSYTLHSVIGNTVSAEVEKVDEYEVKIRVKDLVSGYYLVTIKDNDSKFRGTYKFLKL